MRRIGRWGKVAICCGAVLLLCGGVLAHGLYYSQRNEAEMEVPAAPGESAAYVLRAHDGCICVFREGQEMPVLHTDIRLDSLRGADRELLQSGIRAETYGQVMAFLEDFDS